MAKKLLIILSFLLFSMHLMHGASDRYIELADSADFFIANEQWDQAESKIVEALRLEPANFTNSLLLSNLGYVQTAKGEYGKALESFKLGLSLSPSSTVIYNNRAKTYILLDSIKSAAMDLDRSLQIDLNQEWPLQTRAFIFLRLNQNDSAKILLQELETRFPNNYLAHSGLGVIAEREGRKKDALKEYDKAIELNPEDAETNFSKILLLIDLDDYSQARNVINQCIRDFPEEPVYYLMRGYLHKLNYRLPEAEADRKIAIDKGLDVGLVNQFIPSMKK